MRIYFTRHGESQTNLLHVISNRQLAHGLTGVGWEQAEHLAINLKELQIEHIYTSPLLRAVQTANVLADHLKLPCDIVDGLREFDCGIAEGRIDSAAWELWRAEYQAWVFDRNYAHQIEGGESFYAVRIRFMDFINQIMMKYSTTPSEVVCVSHGGIYSVMLPLILQNVTPNMIAKYGFEYTRYLLAEETASGLVCIEWNGISIVSF